MDRLGKQYGVSTQRFLEANPGVDPKKLRVGQVLNVPVSDRQHIMDTKGFDPETMPKMDRNIYWKQMMHESQLGKYMRPLGNPEGNTSLGWFMMNKPAWDRTVKAYPNLFKGRQHAELATDFNLAHAAYQRYLDLVTRDYQYRTGKQATPETRARLWYSPANPYGAAANKYWADMNRYSTKDIKQRAEQSSDIVYRAAFGKPRTQP